MDFGATLPWLSMIDIGGFSIIPALIGGLIAHSKGRNPILWGLICAFASCIGLIVIICISDLEESPPKMRRRHHDDPEDDLSLQDKIMDRLDELDARMNENTRELGENLGFESDDAAGQGSGLGHPEWYFEKGGGHDGPVTATRLGDMLREGELKLSSLIWRPGMAEWEAIADVKDFGSKG